MPLKKLTAVALTASVMAMPAQTLKADEFVGGLVGGLIGGAVGAGIVNHQNNQRQQQQSTTRTRTVYVNPQASAQRAENRQVQTSLNYFGFPAGVADGVLGARSRSAVSAFQIYMGFPGTGTLNEYEKNLLLGSYGRALSGGPDVATIIAKSPDGVRGVLKAQRDGTVVASTPNYNANTLATQQLIQPQQQTQLAGVQPSQPTTNSVPQFQTQQPVEASTGLPVFNTQAAQKSLDSFCVKINLVTTTNQGFNTVETMSDPTFALSEQFCLARSYAVAEGEKLMQTVQGATPQQIDAQCDAFGGKLSSQIKSLGTKTSASVLSDVNTVAANSGMTSDQLRTTSEICMASGYKTDNMQTALAGALLLTTLGERPVAELIGHHLQGGFGVAENDDKAVNWYNMALTALDSGSAPAFAPDQVDRVDVLRQATLKLSGAETTVTVPAAATSTGDGSLPVFSLTE